MRATKIKNAKFAFTTKNNVNEKVTVSTFSHAHRTKCTWLFGVESDGSFAIPAVKGQAQEATSIGNKRTECGPYKQYSASVGAEIGKYSSYSIPSGVAATAPYFPKIELSCQRIYQPIDQELLHRGDFKSRGPKTKRTLLRTRQLPFQN